MAKNEATHKKFQIKGRFFGKKGGSAKKNRQSKIKLPKWLRAIGAYFAGSWHELREVRWPTRRATWGLTFAVIIFTFALVGFILALDFGFEQLFKKVIL